MVFRFGGFGRNSKNFKRSEEIKEEFKNFNKGFKEKTETTVRRFRRTIFILFPIALLIYYFVSLPPLNLHSIEFWIFAGIILIGSGLIYAPYFKIAKNWFRGLAILALVLGILALSSTEFFNARRYANILISNDGSFTEDVKEIPVDKIPTVDRDTAERLGSRKMGELIDLVSQFNLDNSYTQVNYEGRPVRVTPLEYNGILKWLTNHRNGIPYYMMVDMINGDSNLQKSDGSIKYSKSDRFFRDALRKIRFSYPLEITGKISFEIDDKGHPYWITPTYKNRISWFGAMDVKGAIILDAVTGQAEKFALEDIPTWVDRVFSAEDIIRQLDWNGKYKNGFINSRFAQKGVLQTTQGYNYLAIDDDVYLYTGITSVAADESNVGFVLVNLRTKDSTFYTVSSAEEYSAMASAEGEVQEKEYTATFPILLNIENKPTYFLALKDKAGLIKSYAFIDAQHYQNVSIGNTVQIAYKNHLGERVVEVEEDIDPELILQGQGTIESIETVVIDGNSHYYFILDGIEGIYLTDISLSSQLPFLKAGEKIEFEYIENKDANRLIMLEVLK